MKREVFLRQMLGITKIRSALMISTMKKVIQSVAFQQIKKSASSQTRQSEKIFDLSKSFGPSLNYSRIKQELPNVDEKLIQEFLQEVSPFELQKQWGQIKIMLVQFLKQLQFKKLEESSTSQKMKQQNIDYEKIKLLEEREIELDQLEKELNAKEDFYNEMIAQLKVQQQELRLKFQLLDQGKLISPEHTDQYIEQKWQQQREDLQKEKRYPFVNNKQKQKFKKKLSKLRKDYEEETFDLERQKFWKTRFYTILNNIFRNSRKRERVLKLVGFTTMIKNISLLKLQPKKKCLFETFAQQPEVFENQKYQTKNPKGSITPRTSKSQDKNKSKGGSKRNEQQDEFQQVKKIHSKQKNQKLHHLKLRKLNSVSKMFQFHYRKGLDDQSSLFVSFMKWNRQSRSFENKALLDELNSINFLVNERMFRENLFRTKLQFVKAEMESKMVLINELVHTLLTRTK